MNRGLLYLLRKRPVAHVRSIRRRLGLWKSLLLAGFVLFVLGSVVLSRVLSGLDEELKRDVALHVATNARVFRAIGPLGILGMALLAAVGGGGLYFRKEEIDFLFPAPLSRRSLLLYNVAGRLWVQLLSAAWISVIFFDSFGTFLGGFLGTFLVFSAIQLLSQNVSVLSAAADKRIPAPLRWFGLTGVVALAYGAFRARAAELPAQTDLVDQIEAFVDTPVLRVICAPTRPFIETVLAPDLATALIPIALSLGLIGLLVGSLAVLDVAFLEASLHHSRKVQARLERMRGGGGAYAGGKGSGGLRFLVPRFPRLGGAGTMAWRQTVELSRNVRGLFGMFLTALLFGGVFLGMSAIGEGDEPLAFPIGGVAMTFMFVTMMTQNFAFDFRRDLDRLALLRALPISPLSLAAGQMVPAAVALSLVQFAVGTLVLVGAGGAIVSAIIAWLVLVPPFCYLIIATDNAVFLFLPYRLATDDPGNLPFMGRIMFVMGIKGAVLLGLAVLGFGIGAGAYFLGGESVVFGAIVAALVLVAAAFPATWVVAIAFQRFDLGKDVPA